MSSRLFTALVLALLLAACQPSADPETSSVSAPEQAPPPVAEPAPVADEATAIAELPQVPGEGIDPARFSEHVRILASDEFGGRAPGTEGERLTLEYLVAQFKAMGLEPGYGEDYLQPVPMLEVVNQGRSSLDVQFAEERMELGYPDEMIVNSLRPGDTTHTVTDSELVFVGYGIVAPEYGWDDYAGIDARGKTVVVLVNDPGFASNDPELFNGRAMTYYGRWTYKYEEAARQGAAAALIVHETEPASYPWEVVINSWSGSEFILASDESTPRVALEGWVTVDAARRLFQAAGKAYDEVKERAGQPGFVAVDLGARVSAGVTNKTRRELSYNVLAELPGSQRPEEAILYSAHWDHLGQDPDIEGSDGIYSGAIDNASGVAALLELARLNAEAGPAERSQLFMAVTLEESGLLGSAQYAADPVYAPGKTVAAINMDALSIIGPTYDVVVVGHGSSELEELLAAAAERQGRHTVPEPRPEGGSYYRSDHFNFAKIGIPALYASGGVDHRELGPDYGRAQRAEYGRNRYHKPADVFEEDWDLRGVVEDLSLFYIVGRAVADGDQWPQWYEGNEFRAIREQSLAE